MMPWPTTLFIAAVVIATAVELWLAARQIAAVASHRDRIPQPFAGQLSPEDHRKAADYTVAKARLGMVSTVIDSIVTLALTVGGGIAAIDALWRHTGWGEPWLGLVVIGTVAAVVGIIGLPFSVVRTFRIEAAFGFNRMTPMIFLGDLAKGILLGVLIGGPLVLAVLVLMDDAGRWWWLAAFGCWLVVTLLITWAWPAFIAPLFNKFSPLEDASLKGRIEALLERCGFRSSGVFVVDGSRRSAHGNAYFTGIGRHKRIVFFDTLLKQLASPEIEAVLAHEPTAAGVLRHHVGRIRAAWLAGRETRILSGARSADAVDPCRADPVCPGGAGGGVLHHSARLTLVAPSRVRRRPLRLPARECTGARLGARQALSRERQHADPRSALHRLLLLAPPGARAYRAAHRSRAGPHLTWREFDANFAGVNTATRKQQQTRFSLAGNACVRSESAA
jgi:Zn-dependent protease with chaperone function